jgi:para-aminobenzoate synthetase / 4-amino-4-deoxychorismate lyase
MSFASTSSSAAAHAPARGPRPDARAGVFETLLVLDGRPLELEAHLERLDASTRALFGVPAPATARRLVLDHARGADVARLRLTVTPGDDDDGAPAAEVVVARVDPSLVLPDADHGVELAPVVVEGGLGAHKWADRRLLAAAEADVAPRVPLLLDRDGAVLEASRGSVFVVCAGTLLTPPSDGRILPGITRGRVIRIAKALGVPVREEAVTYDRLADANEAFLTGAVRGIEPVRGGDNAVAGSVQQITPMLSRELRRCWRTDHVLRGGSAPHAERD